MLSERGGAATGGCPNGVTNVASIVDMPAVLGDNRAVVFLLFDPDPGSAFVGRSNCDEHSAQSSYYFISAIPLLGSRVVLTSIRPEVAQPLVSLGVDLREIITCSTLQNGIAYASSMR